MSRHHEPVGRHLIATVARARPEERVEAVRARLAHEKPASLELVLVAGADTAISLAAGFAVFPLVFANGLDPASGPGLVFVTLPIAVARLPFGGAGRRRPAGRCPGRCWRRSCARRRAAPRCSAGCCAG